MRGELRLRHGGICEGEKEKALYLKRRCAISVLFQMIRGSLQDRRSRNLLTKISCWKLIKPWREFFVERSVYRRFSRTSG